MAQYKYEYTDFAMTDCHKRTELNPKGVPAMSSLRTPLVRIEDHKSEVLSCAFHPTGKFFLSSNRDGQIHMCNIDGTSSKMSQMKGHTDAVVEAHFSKNGMDIYSCSIDKTLGIWDAFMGSRISILEGHTGSVNCVQGSRIEYPILCSGSNDRTVRIWDARNQETVLLLGNGAEVNATCFNENGEYVFSGGFDKDIKIWDLRMTEVMCTLKGHTGTVTGLSLSPCGSYLLSHSVDNTLRIWDVRPFASADRCVISFPSNEYFVGGLLRCAWSPDGTMVSAGTAECDVFIWDANTGEKLYELPGHENSVNDIAFHPKELIILSASNDKFLYLHEI